MGCLWFHNHANLVELGIDSQMPRFEITQEKREDPRERAQVAQQLFQMGVPLSMQDVLDQTGVTRPEEGEDTIEQPEQMPGMGGMPGRGGPPGGGFPGGGGGGFPDLGGDPERPEQFQKQIGDKTRQGVKRTQSRGGAVVDGETFLYSIYH